MSTYDVDEIKRRIDISGVLNLHAITPPTGKRKISCPLPGHVDRNPSFGSIGGGQLFRCYSQCQCQGDIFDLEQRLSGSDFKTALATLAEAAGVNGEVSHRRQIDTVYDYADLDGNLIHQTVRFKPKRFLQRRPATPEEREAGCALNPFDRNPLVNDEGKQYKVDHDGIIWTLKGITPILYRLSDWHDVTKVCIVEGEKDADCLVDRRFAATTCPMGAKYWRDSYDSFFADKDVVLLPDNDDAGIERVNKIAWRLREIASSIRIVKTSNEPGGDVSDYFHGGGTSSSLRTLIDDIRPVKTKRMLPPKDRRAETSPNNGAKGGRPRIPITTITNEFAATRRDSNDLLLDRFFRGKWYRYRGTSYSEMSVQDVKSAMTEWLREHQPDYATRNMVENMLTNYLAFDLGAVESTTPFPCWLSNGTSAADWLVMKNCAVNVRAAAQEINGESGLECTHDPTPDLFSTFSVAYDFDPDARCPIWLKYLEGVQPDPAGRDVLQMLAGLVLVADTRYNVAFFFFGESGCGKSVFINVLTNLVGTDNVCCVPLADFNQRFSTCQLTEKLLNVVGDLPTESDQGRTLSHLEGFFKDCTDGSWLPCEHKYSEPFTAPAIARNLFAGNDLPRFTDRSNAMWDRIRIIPFNVRFRDTDDENLDLRYEIVETELPGVFMWAINGLARLLMERRFPEHPEGKAAKEAHRQRCDPETAFFDEFYESVDSEETYVSADDVYKHYRQWMQDNGYRGIMSAFNFSDIVCRRRNCVKRKRRDSDGNLWRFIGMKNR